LPGDRIGDHLIVSRYLLQRIAEKHGADVSFHPKPVIGWNGSGGHTNFSTKAMRENISAIYEGCAKLAAKHVEHMAIYGKYNDQRLCGNFETSDPSTFSYGVGDRSCSVRIPQHVFNDKKGYLEDRRPASNMDPYLVCGKIVETVCF
jgi:glutamine synthetase